MNRNKENNSKRPISDRRKKRVQNKNNERGKKTM